MAARTTARFVFGALGFLLAACSSQATVFVDVHTDFAASREFDAVRVSTPSARLVAPADARDWLTGARVGPLTGPEGRETLTVELLAGERTVVRRTIRLVVAGTVVVPVWLVRACADVVCPEAGGDGFATECEDGRCVRPECTSTAAASCPAPACSTARDCDTPAAACAVAACRDGHCLAEPVALACLPAQWCDPDLGCRADSLDGGVPDAAADAGCVEPCDDGDPCTHTDRCVGAVCAGAGISCRDEECIDRSCNGTATCDESYPRGAACASDGDPCTDDTCDAFGACNHRFVAGMACPAGLCCAGTCRDTDTAPMHCGGCGIRCATGRPCVGGMCM